MLQTGDIIFVRGTGLLAAAIRFFTQSPYTHVALVFRVADIEETKYVGVAEAQAGGFVITRYGEDWVKSNAVVGRVFNKLSQEQRDMIRSGILKEIGKKYDWLDLIKIVLPIKDKKESDSRLICSEAIARIYAQLGVRFTNGSFDNVTPADIRNSKHINLLTL